MFLYQLSRSQIFFSIYRQCEKKIRKKKYEHYSDYLYSLFIVLNHMTILLGCYPTNHQGETRQGEKDQIQIERQTFGKKEVKSYNPAVAVSFA